MESFTENIDSLFKAQRINRGEAFSKIIYLEEREPIVDFKESKEEVEEEEEL